MKSKLTQAMREMRKGESQQQQAMQLNVSRETVSAYETGRARIPADIAKSMMKKNENPRFAFAIRNEYTKTGPIWLDGPNVDLHRSSVREKTLEELEEVIGLLKEFSFARPLQTLPTWEAPSLDNLLKEVVEAITAMEHFAVVVCEEAGISYTDVWSKHYQYLKAKGYVQA